MRAGRFTQGVRIDYILASKGLLDKVVSCEVILDLPPKWCATAKPTPAGAPMLGDISLILLEE